MSGQTRESFSNGLYRRGVKEHIHSLLRYRTCTFCTTYIHIYTTSLIKRPHNIIPSHIRREITLHTFHPVGSLEGGCVAPWLERELLLNDPREALRPRLARKRVRCVRNEIRVNQIRTTVKGGQSALDIRVSGKIQHTGPRYLYTNDANQRHAGGRK